MGIEEAEGARKKMVRLLANGRKGYLGLPVTMEGIVGCSSTYPKYSITQNGFEISITAYNKEKKLQANIKRLIEKAYVERKRIYVKGDLTITGLFVHEVVFPEQSGELSVCQNGLEGCLTLSDEDGKLSLTEDEK